MNTRNLRHMARIFDGVVVVALTFISLALAGATAAVGA